MTEAQVFRAARWHWMRRWVAETIPMSRRLDRLLARYYRPAVVKVTSANSGLSAPGRWP